jgi:hypothetical protein
MSELDWMQRSFLIIGSFLSGSVLVYIACIYGSISIPIPYIEQVVVVGKIELLAFGAICLGVQTHCYKIQKKLIECFAKGIEG